MTRLACALFALLLLGSLWGCFDYVQIDRDEIAPQSPLRVAFSDPTDVELSTEVEVRDVIGVDGTLVQQRGDTLVLRLNRLRRTGERVMSPPADELLWVPQNRIARLEGKQVNGVQTALLAGGVSLGGGLIAGAVLGGDLGGDGGDPEETGNMPTLESRGIGFRIPFSLFGGR